MEERNSLIFDGELVMNELKKTIKQIFKTNEWIETFDGNEIKVITKQERTSDKFPVVSLNIFDDLPYNRTRDSNQIANHTQFALRVTIYNKESKSKKLDRETLSRRIANEIILNFQQKFGYSHSYNQLAPNEDVSVARRIIGYNMIINNKTYAIYIQ